MKGAALPVWVLFFAISNGTQAYVDEPLPDRDGAGELTCRECHVHEPKQAEAGKLTVEGLPARYQPGQQYPLTVRLSFPNMMRAGFESSVRDAKGAQAGALSSAEERLGINLDPKTGVQFAHHTKRGTALTDSDAVWWFIWTAPEKPAGPVTVRAAGNASNGDDSALGDVILFFSRTIDGPR